MQAKYAERAWSPKQLYKVPAKFMEDDDVSIESDDEDMNEQIPASYKQNKTVENLTKKQIKASIINNDKLNTTDIDYTKVNFNYENLLKEEQIYTQIIKKIELKADIDDLIIQWFEIVNDNYDIYGLEYLFSDKHNQKIIRQHFTYELLVMGLSFGRRVGKSEQLNSALKTCFFYLHQNYMAVLLFVIQKSSTETLSSNEFAIKCNDKVNENKIWLNKSNCKKFLHNNTKTMYNILKNLITLIKKAAEENYDTEDLVNLSIVINYFRNVTKFKLEVIRDNIHTKVNNNMLISQLVVERSLKNTIKTENNTDIEDLDQGQLDKTLGLPLVPFLPDLHPEKKYTLVLDLDETLVHYVEENDSAFIQIRPGAENFIEELANYYEIVIFTAAMQDVIFILLILVCRPCT